VNEYDERGAFILDKSVGLWLLFAVHCTRSAVECDDILSASPSQNVFSEVGFARFFLCPHHRNSEDSLGVLLPAASCRMLEK
jgi:hypothetical protein